MTTARAYYNEFDPYAAAWLRNLIEAGLIAPGDVEVKVLILARPVSNAYGLGERGTLGTAHKPFQATCNFAHCAKHHFSHDQVYAQCRERVSHRMIRMPLGRLDYTCENVADCFPVAVCVLCADDIEILVPDCACATHGLSVKHEHVGIRQSMSFSDSDHAEEENAFRKPHTLCQRQLPFLIVSSGKQHHIFESKNGSSTAGTDTQFRTGRMLVFSCPNYTILQGVAA